MQSLLSHHIATARRPLQYRSGGDWAGEMALIGWRMLWALGSITRGEFSLLRASFFLTHK